MSDIVSLYEKRIDRMMDKIFGDKPSELKSITKLAIMNKEDTPEVKCLLEQMREDKIKEKEQVVKKQKKEPKVIYQDASESEEEVVIVKKKKKQPKVVYESESEEEPPPPKQKPKPVVPVAEKQPQIIKTHQIRFF